MPYYDPYSGMEVETEEERKAREAAEKTADNTVAQEHKVTTYQNGSQTVETKQELPPEQAQGLKAKPTIFENLGNAVAAMPQNFVNNLNRGLTNIQNAPANFAANVQTMPDQFAAETERLKRQAAGQPVAPQATQAPQTTQAPQATSAPQAPEQPQATQAPQLNFDRNAYNASIAQQESGNNPNIGYHDRTKSTAFGSFGITAPAYADARRVDPSLPADITQATQEQQTRAHNIITDNNARFLQSKGVEATPGALSSSHLLGANGLYKFLTQKDEQGRPYLSPQAQAANGGYDNLARIVNGRLSGQAVPSSGAAQPQAGAGRGFVNPPTVGAIAPQTMNEQAGVVPEATPAPTVEPQLNSFDAFGTPVYSPEAAILQGHVDRFAGAQGKPMDMLQIYQDTNAPEWMRKQAGNEVAKMVKDNTDEQTATNTLPTKTPKELADIAQGKDKTGVGDWLQYLLFKHVGLTDLANEKGEQLGIGHKWEGAMDAEGNQGMIKYSANGRPLSGIKGDGTEMSKEELSAFVTQSTQTKTLQTQAGQASNHIMTQMREENTKLANSRMPPRYTDEEILAAGRNAYNQTMRSRAGGVGTSAGPGNVPAGPGNAPTPGPATTGVQAMIDKMRAQPGSASVQIARQKELDKISPEGIEAQAQRIANYQEKMPATGRGTLAGQILSQRVAELNKDYDVNKFEAMRTQIQTAEKAWTGGGKNAQQVQQLDRAAGHIAEYEPVMNNLGNTNSPVFNKWMQEYQRQTGKAAPVDASAAGKIIADEVMKTVLGTGAGSAKEREALQKDFSAASSPDQYRAIIARCKSLMGSQASALERQYKTDFKGRDDFDTRIGPAAQDILKMGRHADQQESARQWLKANPNDPRAEAVRKKLGE